MRILQYNNPEDAKVLETFCEPIAINDYRDMLDIKQHIRDMIQICKDTKAVGIASNQIGITKRFFYMNTPDNQLVYINPTLIKGVGSIESEEGCLSFKGEQKKTIPRFKKIYVEFTDIDTKERLKQTLEGLEARVFQHELDHLDGITI